MHGAVERGRKVARVRQGRAVLDGGVRSVDGGDECRIDGIARRRGGRRVERRRVGGGAHGDEHDEQVDEDGHVGKPGELLQGPNLAQDEAGEGPDQAANSIAELEFYGFRQRFAVGYDDGADVADKLDGLKDIEQVAAPCSVDTEAYVSE